MTPKFPFQKNKISDNNSTIFKASRRDFLKTSGSLSLGALVLGVAWACGDTKNEIPENLISYSPHAFISLSSNGEVQIVAHRSEMGQGIRTSLPLIIADEMDADWGKVKIVQAPGNEEKYGNQNTDGSFSVRMFYKPMREAGATIRQLLINAAAQKWEVSASECTAANHKVMHQASGKEASYGSLVEIAQTLPLPELETIQLKDPSQFNQIGKKTAIVDLQDIITGQATFGIDAKVPGMKIAVMQRCPVVGGTVKSFNEAAAMAIQGVLKVVEIKGVGLPPQLDKPLGGIAVVAENTWAAIKGRDALGVQWDFGPNADYDSEKHQQQLLASLRKSGTMCREKGNFNQALKGAAKVIEGEYLAPYYTHATLEPPCALAQVGADKCEVWAPTQHPQWVLGSLAGALELKPEQVTVNVTLLGGAFGRKSSPDFVVEAALISQKSGHPIKIQWTREDDIKHGFYHAISAQRIRATIDQSNKVSGWNHRTAFPSIGFTSNPEQTHPSDSEMSLGASNFPYDVPAIKIESLASKSPLRIGWIRSVSNIHHAFAIGSMIDKIAEARQMDPIENALDMMGADKVLTFENEMATKFSNYGESLEDYPFDIGRMKNVIRRVAKESKWGSPLPEGRARGFAMHYSFLTPVACVVEVAIDADNNLSIPEVHYALDCGVAVNVDRVISQFEGGAVFATSFAMTSEITLKNGRVEQSNYDDYQIPRMPQSPKKVEVHIVESNAKPTGVGEPPVPPFIPALCNAIYAINGKRIKRLPIDLNA